MATSFKAGRAAMLEDLKRSIPLAMIERAKHGASDGALVEMFDRAKAQARSDGIEGGKVLGAAIANVLIDQAGEVLALLEQLHARELQASEPKRRATRSKAKRE